MKYPLKWYHWAGRELKCYFFGHQWEHAKTYKTEQYDKDDVEIPYSVRKRGRGNYMWDTYAWWEHRCPRCRLKTKHCPWYPWYKCWGQAIYYGMSHVKTIIECLFIDYTEVPLYKRVLVAFPLMLAYGLEGFFVQFDWKTIHFPLEITSTIISKLHEYMDSNT